MDFGIFRIIREDVENVRLIQECLSDSRPPGTSMLKEVMMFLPAR